MSRVEEGVPTLIGRAELELATKSDLREMEARLVGQLTLVRWMVAVVIIVNVIPVLKIVFG